MEIEEARETLRRLAVFLRRGGAFVADVDAAKAIEAVLADTPAFNYQCAACGFSVDPCGNCGAERRSTTKRRPERVFEGPPESGKLVVDQAVDAFAADLKAIIGLAVTARNAEVKRIVEEVRTQYTQHMGISPSDRQAALDACDEIKRRLKESDG